jgi:hypothetical protein
VPHIDPWERAADCERAANRHQDNADGFSIFTHLRDLWIALANKRAFLDEAEFERQACAINRMQVDMTSA